MGSQPAPSLEDVLGNTESDVKMRCGTRILGWKWSPQLPSTET